ncbi:MAG: RIP metalloprotease RseP [Saprospiraceae bacterium]|nr:RIP metalloprotease RseP [Saprospiraceae bacterium]
MEILIKISQLLLCLTILVVIHEFGHFLPARWFKTRVEKFYLFFNPWFSIFKKKIGDTEWGLGWLPLGGYVKISGMVDESFDMNQLQSDPQPWEFRSKPAWQRLIIMVGGVTVNFAFGFFIFSMLLWKNGQTYLLNSELKYGIAVDSLAYNMGLRDGDQLLKVGDLPLQKFDKAKIVKTLVLEKNNAVELIRDGEKMNLQINQEVISQLTKPELKNIDFITPRVPAKVRELMKNSDAEKAGILEGDRFLSLNDQSALYLHEIHRIINKQANKTFELKLLRNSDTIQIPVTTDENGIVGVFWQPIDSFMKFETETFGFFAAIPKGIQTGCDLLTSQLKAFSKMFSGEIKAKDSLGGFGSITNMFPASWDWDAFWRMTAVLSIILGFMNLLPIPALDGGYVVFLLIEVVTGKKVPDKVVEKATFIGFILLMALMLYANGLDVLRGLGK